MRVDQIETGSVEDVAALAGGTGKLTSEAFANIIGDFYLTNPMARASAVMAECSALAAGRLASAAELGRITDQTSPARNVVFKIAT